MFQVHEIAPFYRPDSRILILGSFPSVASRREGFYYAHPQNRFWRVLADVFGEETPYGTDAKKEFLTRRKIALWDVIAECDIEGSGDSSIKAPDCNDIAGLLKSTAVTAVFTTGAKAYELYEKRVFPTTGIHAVRLPSTSPANAAYSAEKLAEIWSEEIKKVLT
ncbi:MAG: DNA-deoxyinosine glycosylase [Clostridia bacterium]|nr:DNA-deoxyinosine glycosylase [Clostridia bacterium]